MSFAVDFPKLGRRESTRGEESSDGVARVISYRLESQYLTSTDGFEFTMYSEDPTRLETLEGQPVELFVNGNPQLLGRIERSEVGGNGSLWTYQGRDYLADLVECELDPIIRLKSGETIANIILDAAFCQGIRRVEGPAASRNIRTGLGGSEPVESWRSLKLDDFKPELGVGIYDHINRVLARHALTMQPTLSREAVAVGKPDYAQGATTEVVRRRNGTANTVTSSTAVRDYSRVPTMMLAFGRAGRSNEIRKPVQSFEVINEYLEDTQSEVYRTLFRAGEPITARVKPGDGFIKGMADLYRLITYRDEDARNAEQVNAGLRRELAQRLKDTLSYRCTVQGTSDPVVGLTWGVDTVVDVADEVCRVFEPLWVAGRSFIGDSQGERTQLEMWRPGSFLL